MLRDMDIDHLVNKQNEQKTAPPGEWICYLDKLPERIELEDMEQEYMRLLIESEHLENDKRLLETRKPIEIDLTSRIQIDPYPTGVVGNVVSTFSIPGGAQNQRKIALYAKDILPCYFDPRIFAHTQITVMIDGYQKVKVLGFPSEKILMVGGKSEEHNRMLALKFVNHMQVKMNMPHITMKDFRLKNMVASVKVPFCIDLKKLEDLVGGRATYQPMDIHCCRVISAINPTMVTLFFMAGSFLMTGFKGEEQRNQLYLESCEWAYKCVMADRKKKEFMDKYQKKRKSSSLQNVVETNRELSEINKEELRNAKKIRNKKKREIQKEIYGSGQRGEEYINILNNNNDEEDFYRLLKKKNHAVFAPKQTCQEESVKPTRNLLLDYVIV